MTNKKTVDQINQFKLLQELRVKSDAIASSLTAIVFSDPDGRITYANETFLRLWGCSDISDIIGHSIFTFIQSRQEFERILEHVFAEGSWKGDIVAKAVNGHHLPVQLSVQLVTEEPERSISLVCSFIDMREQHRTPAELKKPLNEFEQRVNSRTIDLAEANEKLRRQIKERKLVERSLRKKERELKLNALHLEETNIALKVSLEKREKEKNELEEMVLTNVRELLLPCLERLRGCRLNDRQRIYVDSLEANILAIASPFLQHLSQYFSDLTPAEHRVASMVKEGKTSREIASLMNISKRGVEFHRNNIRRKLGLTNAKKNLRSCLKSLS